MISRTSWLRLASNRSSSVSGFMSFPFGRELQQIANGLANRRAAGLARQERTDMPD